MDLSMNLDDNILQDTFDFRRIQTQLYSSEMSNSADIVESEYSNGDKNLKNNNLLNGSCSVPVSPSNRIPDDLWNFQENDQILKEKRTFDMESKIKSNKQQQQQQQEFCLRWNNYKNNLTAVFDELLQNESFVDVTLACEGQSIKAHKMVLSACSPYFRRLFYENPCQHPIIIMRDVKWKELKILLQFMYRGELNISKEEMSSLFCVGHMLKIKGLTEITKGNIECSDGMEETSNSLHLILPDNKKDITIYDKKIHHDIITDITENDKKTLDNNRIRQGIELVKNKSVQLDLEIGLEMRQNKDYDNDFVHNLNNETIKRMHRCEYMRKVEKIHRDTTTAVINNGRRMVSTVSRARKRSRVDLKMNDNDNNDNNYNKVDDNDNNDRQKLQYNELKENNREDAVYSIINDDIDDMTSVQKPQTNQMNNSRFIYPMKALTDRTPTLSNNKSATNIFANGSLSRRQDLSESDIKSANRLNGAYTKFSKYSRTWSAVSNTSEQECAGCWSPDKMGNNKSFSCDMHSANCSLKCLCHKNKTQRMLLLQSSKEPFPADIIYPHARLSGTLAAASLAAVSSLTSTLASADDVDRTLAVANSTSKFLNNNQVEERERIRSLNMSPYISPDDFEIKPETAEIIREKLNKANSIQQIADSITPTTSWPETGLDSSVKDSYQYQLQTMWQKCWKNNQQNNLLQQLQLRERGPVKSWKPEAMADAILAVLTKGLSLSQAAKQYDIPYPTFVLYATRVHNLLGPSLDGSSDNRPKTRGRPQRILLGVWPDKVIQSVVKMVVFRDYRAQNQTDHHRPEYLSYFPVVDQLNDS